MLGLYPERHCYQEEKSNDELMSIDISANLRDFDESASCQLMNNEVTAFEPSLIVALETASAEMKDFKQRGSM